MDVDEIAREAVRLDSSGSGAEALATLESAADRVSRADPAAAARLLVDAVEIALGLGGPARAVETAHRAVAVGAISGGVEHLRAIVRLGDALSWAGRYHEATNEWRRAARDLTDDDPRMLAERANALLRLGDVNAHPAAYRALVAARGDGEAAIIADALNLTTAAEVQAGRLLEALRNGEEALALFAGTGTMDESTAIGLVAWVVALLGDAPRAVALVADAGRINRDLRVSSVGGLAHGLLALSTGSSVEAADAFAARLATSRMGFVAAMTGIRPYGADLIEAFARAGRREAAREALAAMLPVAVGSGQPRLMAPLYRAEGILEGATEPFSRSLEEHQRWGNRYEEARTRLAYGEVLRRQRRRAEARNELAAAAAAFEQLGVGTWRDRAIGELRLAGARTPPPPMPMRGPESLTRQEFEVLDLVRAGLSNRAIAERLVLSVKTIERHLTTIYAKFGVASRTQVLAALARTEGATRVD